MKTSLRAKIGNTCDVWPVDEFRVPDFSSFEMVQILFKNPPNKVCSD